MASSIKFGLSALSMAIMLAACGGGDSGGGSLIGTPPSADNGQNNPAANVGSVRLIANKTRVGTAGTDEAEIRAIVKNKNGIVLEGIEVDFKVSNDGTLRIEGATPDNSGNVKAVTDASGVATAFISSSGNNQNRQVGIEATAGPAKSAINIAVEGTAINITGPDAIPSGESATFIAALTDSDGRAIAGQPVSIASERSQISSTSQFTDNGGEVSVLLTAQSGGIDQLTFNAFSGESAVSASRTINISADNFQFSGPDAKTEIRLGDTQPISVQWSVNGAPVSGDLVTFSITRGNISDSISGVFEPSKAVLAVNGSATVYAKANTAGPTVITARTSDGISTQRELEFIAISADKIASRAEPSQLSFGEKSEISAIVRDSENNLVKGAVVNFNLQDLSRGTISTGSAVTNSNGVARTIYTAGQTSTSRDGVKITASVGSITNTVSLTVSDKPLRVAIGTGNQIQEPNTTTYKKSWAAIVSDANGNPVQNAKIELSVLPTFYYKGKYVPVDTDLDGKPDAWRPLYTSTNPDKSGPEYTHSACPSEDSNRNGILDPGEDSSGTGNRDGLLTPTVPITAPKQILSTADGSVEFDLTYPQSYCSWVAVKVVATVTVDGTESRDSSEFILECLASDLNDIKISPPGGENSPFGIESDCSNPN